MISVCVLCEHAADTVSANVKKEQAFHFCFLSFMQGVCGGVRECGSLGVCQKNRTI